MNFKIQNWIKIVVLKIKAFETNAYGYASQIIF